MEKKIKIALCYDFDGTLSPRCMQEYSFIPALGILPKEFWDESHSIAKKENFDPILSYMYLMLDKAKEKNIPITKQSLKDFGKDVKFFAGVETWFERINRYGNEAGVEVEHYIISSGIEEMIEGTLIAENFRHVFACKFRYDENGLATSPGASVNYTYKTQHLVRISKGIFNYHENEKVNKHIDPAERYIPYSNMVYIGDGETDVPCMKLLKSNEGFAIAVYDADDFNKTQNSFLLHKEKRANFVAPANFSENSRMDKIVKKIIDFVKVRTSLDLKRTCNLYKH